MARRRYRITLHHWDIRSGTRWTTLGTSPTSVRQAVGELVALRESGCMATTLHQWTITSDDATHKTVIARSAIQLAEAQGILLD